MKELITPCLWYDNKAKEAAKLYCSVLAKAKIVAQSPVVSEIEVDGQHITLLDGGPIYKPNPSISLFYIAETPKEIDLIWEAFSKNGQILMGLDKYPWSEKYGWLNDEFGISWQLSLGKIKDVGQRISPSFLFNGDQYGRAEKAMEFYTTIFKGSKIEGVLRYGKDEAPDQEGNIKHGQLSLGGQKFMFMDSGHPHKFDFNEAVSLTIHCETQDQIDYYWSKLTQAGEESMCGWLKDQFGISWQVIPAMLSELMTNPDKAGKAAKAFMQMRKFDIEKLVQATI